MAESLAPRLTPAAEARIRHGLTVETVYSPQAAEAIRLLLAEVETLRKVWRN